MRTIHYLALAAALLLTAISAQAQKTAYGYTMLPSTTPAMISFNTDDPSVVTRLGTYSKAEPRSGALVGSTLYMMGIDDDFNMWFYSIAPDGDGQTIKKLGEATCPGDMSYDYTVKTMYFIANSEDVDGVSAIGKVNMENGEMTFVANLAYYCKAIAIDARGQMYVLTNSGYLLKVDKNNGDCTLVGATGIEFASWWNFQSMEFDRETGTLYLAAWGSDEKTSLYTINTTTGKATKVGTIGDGTHVIALGIPYKPSSGSAPDCVNDLTLTPDPNGELLATLSWVNPVNDYEGNPLEGTVSINIVHTQTGKNKTFAGYEPGQAMETRFEVENAGMQDFAVTAYNQAGTSLVQHVEAWVGHDTPGMVINPRATLNRNMLMVNDLAWEAPAKGMHGGYVETDGLCYDIIRINDGKTIAEGIDATSWSDDELLPDLTRYTYQIKARNADGISENATTNDIVNGPALDCPYVAPFNSWEESGQFWTILDANEDGYPFVWYKDFMNMFGQGGDKCFFIYQPNQIHYAYDFIISPPINFTEGHEYRITATVGNDDIYGYRQESFRFYTFAGYDMAGAIPLGNEAFTVKHHHEFRDYSITFRVEDDGYGAADETFPSFIALCCNSQYDMGMLLVSAMAVEDITPVVPLFGNVNGDGEVNIADINALIDLILDDVVTENGDLNGDHEVNLGDINTLIDLILSM